MGMGTGRALARVQVPLSHLCDRLGYGTFVWQRPGRSCVVGGALVMTRSGGGLLVEGGSHGSPDRRGLAEFWNFRLLSTSGPGVAVSWLHC